ncbi:hypothetical protein Pint_06438 [Pistacia integerrima]|uniref:Uncharacterized protein n=1 Tax=Pistacia integerrima TaxID=434235 RepID=A0ACC0Z9Q8_9ROSI|nr:hypothetical protein Pint_06438 [Pistacia integerrima]
MPEKSEMANKNPKKANLLDHHSIKHVLDETVPEIVGSRGYVEDVRKSNIRLFMGSIIIVIALVAQFYKKKFPENRDFLIGCIALYPFLLFIHTKEKNAILFTYPPEVFCGYLLIGFLSPGVQIHFILRRAVGSFSSTGLVVSSKLPRFSDQYTLTIASADPKSISAGQPVELTKSVTKWFTKDGVLVEGVFWEDVLALVDKYTAEPKKKK